MHNDISSNATINERSEYPLTGRLRNCNSQHKGYRCWGYGQHDGHSRFTSGTPYGVTEKLRPQNEQLTLKKGIRVEGVKDVNWPLSE